LEFPGTTLWSLQEKHWHELRYHLAEYKI
jgi:hypothetical protein